jgi:quercetin dioxygenase-like cupin family protein
VQHWDLIAVDAPRGTLDPTVIFEDDGARAVLVALDPGQALGDHQVKENAWVTVIEGTVQATAGAESVELGPGGFLHFEPGERHSVGSTGGARILLMLAPWPAEGHFHET